jgi:AraC-like DNA-binding protein
MKEAIFDAGPSLSGVINYIYSVSGTRNDEKIVKQLLPNFEMMLVFNFGPPIPISFRNDPFGEIEINRTAVIGPLKKKLNYELRPPCDFLIANFTLNGFYRMFGVSFEEVDLFDPDELSPSGNYKVIWSRLKGIDHITERSDLLKTCLLELFDNSDPASETLLEGRSYFDDPTKQPVKAIAAKNEVAERTVQLRFKKYFGYSTKEMLRFKRFKAIVIYLLNPKKEKINWPGVASAFGYYDQSHLIKDFKYFLDTTPEYFLANTAEFCIIQDSKY